jgi:hypothetical protein
MYTGTLISGLFDTVDKFSRVEARSLPAVALPPGAGAEQTSASDAAAPANAGPVVLPSTSVPTEEPDAS